MQTMMYGLLYKETSQGSMNVPLKPAVFNLKDIFNEGFNPYLQMGTRGVKMEVQSYQEYESEYLDALEGCIIEIFHPDVPFSQNEEEIKCGNCPYAGICRER